MTGGGIRIKHLEDDFEETLPLDALGGGKYLLEPVDSDDEADNKAWTNFIMTQKCMKMILSTCNPPAGNSSFCRCLRIADFWLKRAARPIWQP